MDDGIGGSCGLICRVLQHGSFIHYVSFSFAQKSIQPNTPLNTTENEFYKVMEFLKIKHFNVYPYEVRIFPSFRQEILELLIDLKNEIKPDVVVMPTMNDYHQDHKTIAEEGFRAFKDITILGYEMPRNMINASPNLFIRMSRQEVFIKMQALDIFESQKWRPNFVKSIIVLNEMRGHQIDVKYAESYEVIRWIL
uniref:Putative N-acetylglucosaminylphosphatidylinositol de-N-acetylase n=1 Tax=viral metagenome TaxID=1070528 RepID=A0A6M3LK24_9ZZZZ